MYVIKHIINYIDINFVPAFLTWDIGRFRFKHGELTFPEFGSNAYLFSTFAFIVTHRSTWVGQKMPDKKEFGY